MTRRALRAAIVLSVLVALGLSATAAATPIGGENGRIVLISEQNTGFQKAELFLLPVPFSSGGGTLSPPLTNQPALRHRHPTWSPDRTKIAYARGPSAGPFDIFVQDLTQPLGATNPVNITPDPSSEDRPAWAPNGDYIAFEKDNGNPASREIYVSLPNGGGQTNITNTGAAIEGKPAWHPFSNAIYYEKGNAQNPATDTDIVKVSMTFPGGMPTPGMETLAVADDMNHPEIQPAISPDGSKICYGTGYPGAPSTDVKVAALTGSPASGSKISMNPTAYYCTWSPDGTMVAYTAGAGAAGNLVMVRADGSSPLEIDLATGANIQTNPDWVPDGRPQCPNSSVATTSDQALTIPVECTDTGPEYEQSNVREFINEQPQNGTTEQEFAGDPITYTPNAGFVGVDFIEIRSFDEFGFGGDTGTIAITVTAPDDGGGNGNGNGNGNGDGDGDGDDPLICRGTEATITGTDGDDEIEGSGGNDVIVALGGNDVIKAKKGNDVVCAGTGNDKVKAGGGSDKVFGEGGKDKLFGQGGKKDKLKGGGGRDTLSGGGGKRDLCNGGGSKKDKLKGKTRKKSGCEKVRRVP